MDKRLGVDNVGLTDKPLFVRSNQTFYSSYDIPNYIGEATYGGGEWKMNRAQTPNSLRPTEIKSNEFKDHNEDANGGCCGNSFDIFSDETSFHGLKHIKGGNNWSRRMSWIIILVLALIGLTYQINRSVSRYFDYPTNTNLNYVTKSAITFPKVTVCNSNMFKFDQVTPLLGGSVLFYYHGLQYLRSLTPDIGITSNGNGYGKLEDETYPGKKDLKEFIWYNSHRIKDMLEVCVFNGVICGPENFTLTYTNYGACYAFTPTTNISLNNAGQRYGLSMILNVEHLQYITAPRENVGFRIAIDGYNDDPDIEASGVDVGTGIRASIGLRKQTITSLPPPHGNCIVDGDKQLKYQVNKKYTQSRCLLECETDYFMEVCGCRTFYTPGNETQPFCSPSNLTGCYIPKYDQFADHRQVYCKCEEACSVESFLKTNSFSGFPSRGVPQTFVVTKQWRYYALAFGFNVRQGIEFQMNEIIEQMIEETEQFVIDAFIEVGLPNYTNNLPTEYIEQLAEQFMIFNYDAIFYLTNKISDNIFYDLIFEYPATEVGSEFHNLTIDGATDELSYQIDVITDTMTEAVQLTYPSHNFTREDAKNYNEVLMKNILESVYPRIRNASLEVGVTIYTTNDLASLTQEYMVDNMARVDIYFETLKVEEIKDQKAYEFFSIICDLGGALGLFFGASLVAFVEAIDFWFIKRCCGPKKK
ncbi:acid-sensing ion channel 1A-like [Anneissia japonica]|uniref:acid-sensing ion channel 1A-like n=1 Tax=Anneissia japonica TaxID=1529436 RepID=UPI0014256320|nr:acid-sensing ion channel 1A-like [Anneissia japonica]